MSEADPPVHTYTWIKKNGTVELESGKGKTLTFSKIRTEDSGDYFCRVDNKIGQRDSAGVTFEVLSMAHDQTIWIAILVGVAVCGVLVLLCVICRLRQSKQVATNNTRTSAEDNQDGNYGNMQINLNPNTTQPDGVYQSLNPNTTQPDAVYQTLNPNTTQPDAVYQTLNPNTTQPDAVYQTLNTNTTQPDAVYQTLNTNTTQPDAVYHTLNPKCHKN
ncbi:Fc receptor-like protein 5 [Sardina pilchardus]|uniref:Fc receptor-like protein 5 n=1 Tax=Sardina pilchardus TaxID=27697 RepID=UPI002E0FDD4C